MSRLPLGLGLLLATLAGVGLGWLLATQLAPQAGEATLHAAPSPADVEAQPATGPALVGIARTSPEGAKAGQTGAPGERPLVSLGGSEALTPLLVLDGQTLPEERGQEVVRALALLYATLGKVEDFERLIGKCLAAGWQAHDLVPLVQLLPAEHRLASYDRLMAGHFAGAAIEPVLLSQVLVDAGAKERAIALLTQHLDQGLDTGVALKLIELDPKGAVAKIQGLEGIEAAESQFLSSAIAALAKAGQADLAWPFVDLLVGRGEVPGEALDQLEEIDPALGIRIVEHVLAAQRDSAEAWRWLGRMKIAGKDSAGAFDAYREALARAVTRDALEGLMRADWQRAYDHVKTLDTSGLTGEDVGLLAVMALQSGTTDEAFATLARGLETSPTEYGLLNAIVRVDPKRAVALLGASAAGYTGDARDELVGAYANALRIAGNAKDARTAYLEAISIDPTDVEWIDGLLQIDAAAAVEHLESVRSGNDDEDWWQRALADGYMRTGRRAEAQTIYGRLSNAAAASSLGRVDPAEGRRRLEQLLSVEPRNAGNWGQLGEMERDLGNLAAARRAFAKAVEIEPTGLWYVVRLRQVNEMLSAPPPPSR